MNISARASQLIDFFNGGEGNSSLESHRDSILLLDKIFKRLKAQIEEPSSQAVDLNEKRSIA